MSHPTRSLLAGVLVTSCVVTAALGWSGLRLLTQQRELDERAVRQRIDVAADGFAAAIRERLAEEGDRLDRWMADPSRAIDGAWPGSVAYVEYRAATAATRAVGLPFGPVTAPEPAPPAVFDASEKVEFALRQPAVAATGYRRLARHADQRVRAGAMFRLSRVLRAQREFAGASEAAAVLAGMDAIDVDGVPASLAGLDALRLAASGAGDLTRARLIGDDIRERLDRGDWLLDRKTAEFLSRPGVWLDSSARVASGRGCVGHVESGRLSTTNETRQQRRGDACRSSPRLLARQ